ncbi:MAG: F420-non-reducing hydrogenase iron-sulfur subunit G [Candidatus Bathyarchaeota archaeon BA1]|nr:MAG: F420-non-reducing hydrogenase iron-sulfur subunit G [Candidatus Bathyarchaeota archaeon BA1]
MEKLKFAFYWAASCGGCEIAVLDINEKILDVVALADIVFWPVAMDIKYKDVEAMPDKSIDVCFFNGSIRTEEQEHIAKLLRKKSKVLVAFGSCAHQGGIPGLANVANKKEVFDRAYLQSPSTPNPNAVTPQTSVKVKEGTLTLPEFYDTVKTLDQTVDVDYYLPGCPPPSKQVAKAVEAIAKNELPPKGSVIGPLKSICDECPRKKEQKKISKIYRVYEITPEPEKCLLEQGIICMGPATRGGCEAQCISADMPCTGCGGPCPNEVEQGAAMISALSSLLGVEEEKEKTYNPEILIAQIKDPLGTFYWYSLPASLLRRRVMKE